MVLRIVLTLVLVTGVTSHVARAVVSTGMLVERLTLRTLEIKNASEVQEAARRIVDVVWGLVYLYAIYVVWSVF